jgi:Tfp pilus assembly protein PilF
MVALFVRAAEKDSAAKITSNAAHVTAEKFAADLRVIPRGLFDDPTAIESAPAFEEARGMKPAAIAAACAACLMLATTAVYFEVVRHPFIDWDDHGQIYENPDFNPPTLAALAKYWYRPHMNLFMPVSYTAWGAIAQFAYEASPDAAGIHLRAKYFHGANVLLHLINVLLVLAILRELTGNLPAATLAACLFAVHPLQVEPVAWASAFYTLLSATFSLAAIWQYIRYANASGDRRTFWRLVGATIFLILAVLSKPSAVVVPLIAAAIDLLLLRRSFKMVFPPIVIWLIIVAPIAWFANHFQPAMIVDSPPLYFRPVIAADAVAFYVAKFFVPIHLATDYARTPQWLAASSWKWITWLIPAAIAILAWAQRRRRPWISAGVAIFALGALPFLGLVKFDLQWFTTVADRYIYISMLGACIVLAHLLVQWPRVRGLGIAILIVLAVRAHQQTHYWRDTRTLFNHTLDVTPNSLIAHNVLAHVATNEGSRNEAAALYRRSLDIRPLDPTANYNLANLLLADDDPAAAAVLYRHALIKDPRNAKAYNNLGIALTMIGEDRAARQAYATAIALNDSFPDPRANLARSLLTAGDYAGAIRLYEEALQLDPQFAPALRGIAEARGAAAASQPAAGR